jgi:hypothetical protein
MTVSPTRELIAPGSQEACRLIERLGEWMASVALRRAPVTHSAQCVMLCSQGSSRVLARERAGIPPVPLSATKPLDDVMLPRVPLI